MPRKKTKSLTFEAQVTRTLTLTTTIEVEAATEDEAAEHARELAMKGTLTWKIADDLDWQEEDDDVTVDNIDEA